MKLPVKAMIFIFLKKLFLKIDILSMNKNTIDAIWGYVYVDYAAA